MDAWQFTVDHLAGTFAVPSVRWPERLRHAVIADVWIGPGIEVEAWPQIVEPSDRSPSALPSNDGEHWLAR